VVAALRERYAVEAQARAEGVGADELLRRRRRDSRSSTASIGLSPT